MAKTVLLVDDDNDDRALFVEALHSVDPGLICRSTDSAEDALDCVENGIVEPEVMFVDINLPEMSGWQLLRKIKQNEQLKKIPVFMYSTSSHRRDQEIAVDFGAVCLITKPHDYKKLKMFLDIVVRNLEGGSLYLVKDQIELLAN